MGVIWDKSLAFNHDLENRWYVIETKKSNKLDWHSLLQTHFGREMSSVTPESNQNIGQNSTKADF